MEKKVKPCPFCGSDNVELRPGLESNNCYCMEHNGGKERVMEKLKPCPFCGGKAYVQCHIFDGVHETYGVLCTNGKCYTSGWQFYGTAEEAIEAWNRRAERSEE